MSPRTIIIFTGLILLLGVGLFGLTQARVNHTVVVTSGKALVGGSFELTDHTGKSVSDKDYRGKFMLVYFGFTHCPHICPTGLQNIAGALEKLGEGRRNHLAPLFVTIDPKRDTRELMANYVENFHPDLVGLRGSSEQIDKMVATYRVYASKVKDKDSPDDYTMNHSSLIFLMDDKGQYIRFFTHKTDPEKIAKALISILDMKFSSY